MIPILSFNIKNNIENFYLDLLIECIEQRPIPELQDGNNYIFKSKYTNELYDTFISLCKKNLNSFTINSLKFGTWCCLSDKNNNIHQWHNHIKTGTIIGVLYLKIPDLEKNGIDFKLPNNDIYETYNPNPFDLLIFPNYLDHRPHGSKTNKKRISINIELQCKESAENIFYGL